MKKKATNNKDLFSEEIVEKVLAEFSRRQKERKKLEADWKLNLDFLEGRQYESISSSGEIEADGKRFFWQNRGVYNHIAPIMETRLAKLMKVDPVLRVIPASGDDKEMQNARLAEKILSGTFRKLQFRSTVENVTRWSELCGTGFYKVVWDGKAGDKIGVLSGEDVFEGEVKIVPVSPFEIYPDNLSCENLEDLSSIIEAKAVKTDEIYKKFGVKLTGKDTEVIGADIKNSVLKDSVLLIEMYDKPTAENPNGVYAVVADNTLLYYGELPYTNGKNGARDFPYVMQKSCSVAGAFFGKSIIERLIPVQKAYNAVKNRKHEFLNRITMGVIAVEDGSVDIEDLEEEGLPPGKIVVYRQGSKLPELMSENSLPDDFNKEEEKLTDEFVIVSGINDVASSKDSASVKSASALSILVEQDNERMTKVAEKIREAYVFVSVKVLRLYRQFLSGVRAIRSLDDESKTKLYYVDKKVLNSDEVEIINENELLYTEANKKQMLLTVYESGILNGEDGKLKSETRCKILSLLGIKDISNEQELINLHVEKATAENVKLLNKTLTPHYYDDHSVHIEEHIRYVLSEDERLTDTEKANFSAHIKEHRKMYGEDYGK